MHSIRLFFRNKSGKSTIIRNLAVPRHFIAYLVFISSIRVDPGPRNRGPTSLLALKIRTPVANTGKLRFIGQVSVISIPTTLKLHCLSSLRCKSRSIQHYVIKFVSDLLVFSGYSMVSSTNKTDRHESKVALNTIILTITLKTTYSEMVIDVHLTDLLSTISSIDNISI